MKTSFRLGLAAIGIAFLMALGWLWSLGVVASEDVPQIRLDVVRPPVEMKRQAATEWVPVTQSIEVQSGDQIRTGAEGRAEIHWGKRGVTRIDEGTELTITRAPSSGEEGTILIDLRLSSGRTWSRLLKLLDLQSGAFVRTDNVVATVRGTAFGVDRHANVTDLAVTESVVDVSPASGRTSGTLVKEGKWGSFGPSGTPTIIRDLMDTDAWPQENKNLDEAYDEALRHELEERFYARVPKAPLTLVRLSEGLHLILASDEARAKLEGEYARRRIAQILFDPRYGEQDFSDDVLRGLRIPDDEAIRGRLLNDVQQAMLLELQRPLEDQNIFVLKGLLTLRATLLGTSPAGVAYAEALYVDDGIDNLIWHASEMPKEMQEQERAGLLSVLANWETSLKSQSDITEAEKVQLLLKAAALRTRLEGFSFEVLEASSSTSTSDVLPSPTTTPVVPTSDTPAPSAPQPSSPVCNAYRSIALFAKPESNIALGTPVTLTVYGVCADGKTSDITQSATFTSASSFDGSMRGNVFTPAKSGVITLSASYMDHGVKKTAQTTISVLASKRTLTGVTVGAVGPTTLILGQSTALTAKASYSDGTSADILYQCVWSTSDPKIGIITQQRFYASSNIGQVKAICTFSDTGVTVSGNLTFTVQMDNEPAQGGGTQSNPNQQGQQQFLK